MHDSRNIPAAPALTAENRPPTKGRKPRSAGAVAKKRAYQEYDDDPEDDDDSDDEPSAKRAKGKKGTLGRKGVVRP